VLRLRLTIAGETQVARAFDVLARDAQDLRDPLAETHDHLRRVVGEQFASEGSHGGQRWQDLTPAYAERKAQHYGDGRPILVASGDLRAAWLARQPLELSAHRLVMGPREGSEEETRSVAHQTGAGHMPQRKIVNLTLGDRRGIDRIFAEHFSAVIRRLFGAG
jgi:hypothetical protein